MSEILTEAKLGDVPVGDIVVWRSKSFFADVYAEVVEHLDEHTLVLADNNIRYQWRNDMAVFVD